MFDWMRNAETLVLNHGGDIEKAYEALKELYQDWLGASANKAMAQASAGSLMPSLLKFRRQLLYVHNRRHLVTELVGTGKMTEAEAEAMVTAGMTPVNPATSDGVTVAAAGGFFANLFTWLNANLPALEADAVNIITFIAKLLPLLSAAGL